MFDDKEWCSENFVHHRNIKMANEVRKQLAEVCQRVKVPLKSCGQDTTAIRKCVSIGMFKNAAELCADGTYRAVSRVYYLMTHPSQYLIALLITQGETLEVASFPIAN